MGDYETIKHPVPRSCKSVGSVFVLKNNRAEPESNKSAGTKPIIITVISALSRSAFAALGSEPSDVPVSPA